MQDKVVTALTFADCKYLCWWEILAQYQIDLLESSVELHEIQGSRYGSLSHRRGHQKGDKVEWLQAVKSFFDSHVLYYTATRCL